MITYLASKTHYLDIIGTFYHIHTDLQLFFMSCFYLLQMIITLHTSANVLIPCILLCKTKKIQRNLRVVVRFQMR